MALAWLLPSGLTLLMGTASRAPAPAVHMRVVEEVKAAQLSKSEPVAGMVVPAGLKGLSDKVALVGPLTLDAHPEAEAYLGVYTKGMLASRTNPYERIGYYEMVGNPNRMIWWADGVWAVGQGNSKGGRIGVVCVDDQAEAPEVRRSGYSPARVFMLGPPGMTAQSVAPQAARVAPAGAASVVSSVAPAKPKPDRYAPPPVKVDPRFDANAQPMSSFTPAATENRDFQPQALKTQNVAGGQGPADAWTTVRNTKPKPSRTKKGQLEERVARVRATTDGAVEARTKEILKASLEEWAADLIDTAELERRKAEAPKQAAAQLSQASALESAFADYTAAVEAREQAWEAYGKAAGDEEAAEAKLCSALDELDA